MHLKALPYCPTITKNYFKTVGCINRHAKSRPPETRISKHCMLVLQYFHINQRLPVANKNSLRNRKFPQRRKLQLADKSRHFSMRFFLFSEKKKRNEILIDADSKVEIKCHKLNAPKLLVFRRSLGRQPTLTDETNSEAEREIELFRVFPGFPCLCGNQKWPTIKNLARSPSAVYRQQTMGTRRVIVRK